MILWQENVLKIIYEIVVVCTNVNVRINGLNFLHYNVSEWSVNKKPSLAWTGPEFNANKFGAIAMLLVTSPIVIIVPTRGLLAVETMHAIVQWLANLNIKRT